MVPTDNFGRGEPKRNQTEAILLISLMPSCYAKHSCNLRELTTDMSLERYWWSVGQQSTIGGAHTHTKKKPLNKIVYSVDV